MGGFSLDFTCSHAHKGTRRVQQPDPFSATPHSCNPNARVHMSSATTSLGFQGEGSPGRKKKKKSQQPANQTPGLPKLGRTQDAKDEAIQSAKAIADREMSRAPGPRVRGGAAAWRLGGFRVRGREAFKRTRVRGSRHVAMRSRRGGCFGYVLKII